MKKERNLRGLKYLLIIGIAISLFLVYEHFSPSASRFCSFGSSFDCGVVNKSPYANLDGLSYLLTIEKGFDIPLIDISGLGWFFDFITSNAFLGVVMLLLLLGLVRAYEKNKGFLWIKKEKISSWLKGLVTFGFAYGLYLIYIQHYILKSYCIFCLGLDVILLLSLFYVWRLK